MAQDQLLGHTVRGLEDLALDELEAITGSRGEIVAPGRISIPGGSKAVMQANYHSGTCARFCSLLNEFTLETPEDAYERIDTEVGAIMDSDQTFAVRVERRGDHDFSSPDVARQAGQQIVDSFEQEEGETLQVDLDDPDIVFRLDLFDTQAYFSVDTTGDSLNDRDYLRGNREDRTPPILANLLVRASDWDADRSLLDPFCRAGTIPIEAARIACNVPNSGRRFAFLDLGFIDREEYAAIAQQAKDELAIRNLPISGSDPDITGAQMSAKASGFDEMTFREEQALERELDTDIVIFRSPFIEQRSKRKEIADVMERFEKQLQDSDVDEAVSFTQDSDFFSEYDTSQEASWNGLDGHVLTWER